MTTLLSQPGHTVDRARGLACLGSMTPTPALFDVANSTWMNPKVSSDFSLFYAILNHFPDGGYITASEYTPRDAVSPPGVMRGRITPPAFSDLVSHVFKLSAEKQVIGVATGWRIAVMADKKFIWNITVSQNIRESVNAYLFTGLTWTYKDPAVSISLDVSSPHPAITNSHSWGFVNFIPKPVASFFSNFHASYA